LVRIVEIKEQQSRRAPNYYKYNLDTGAKKLVLKGNRENFGYTFDKDGNPRLTTSQTADGKTIFYHRPVGGEGWTEFARVDGNTFQRFRPVGVVQDDDNLIYVLAHNNNDKVGLWKYNLSEKKFEDLVYRRKDVDITGVGYHSNSWEFPGEVTSIGYPGAKRLRKFMDSDEKAIHDQFEAAIPNAYQVRITSRSKDGSVIVVSNRGPKDPGSFYLYNDGAFSKIGGPHPLVVMPHGGPFVGEVSVYDEWAQLLANNGYMVLQPQYRGSTNYGLDFYKSAFINGGEGGGAMQDDKDDGAKYLVSQGLVDPKRMAMFGWSYGGYAALVAASRPDNIYQCVVAGAAVADNVQQVNYYRNRIRGSARTEQLKFWDESLNPINEVEKVNVPMLLIHGSIDQRVPVKHSKKYIDALDKYGKDYQYVELKNADHFSNTIRFDHKMQFYPKMIEFLQNDCGPDGL